MKKMAQILFIIVLAYMLFTILVPRFVSPRISILMLSMAGTGAILTLDRVKILPILASGIVLTLVFLDILRLPYAFLFDCGFMLGGSTLISVIVMFVYATAAYLLFYKLSLLVFKKSSK